MKNIELYSKDIETIKIINEYKKNEKNYNRITNALNILGNFHKKIEVNIYEIKCTEKEYFVKLWLTDLDDNIFIIYSNSLNKRDLNKIAKITNEKETTYDISLLKKYNLNKDNIDLIRIDKIYDFKFGRFITNEKTFFSLFLQNNIVYQINIDSNISIDCKIFISEFNKCDKLDFKDFINIFEKVLLENNIKYSDISISCYKNFERICFLEEKNKDNVKKLKK